MSDNGRLKDSELRDTVVGGRLVPKAARSADRVSLAFAEKFGRSLVATDTYRTRAEQDELWVTKPGFAAPPGTSIHGLGEAVDWSSQINVYGSEENEWMRANSRKHGWVWPEWAQKANRFEPWHYEYHDELDKGRLWLNWPEKGQVGLGADSAYVKSLQAFLNSVRKTHPRIVEDGDYWMATYAAVRWFQKRHGLAPTGVVGTRSKVVLKREGFPLR